MVVFIQKPYNRTQSTGFKHIIFTHTNKKVDVNNSTPTKIQIHLGGRVCKQYIKHESKISSSQQIQNEFVE